MLFKVVFFMLSFAELWSAREHKHDAKEGDKLSPWSREREEITQEAEMEKEDKERVRAALCE